METPGRFPEIETERLVLREITEDDIEWYQSFFSIPEIVDSSGFEGPGDRETAREQLERFILRPFREGTGIRWGISLKGSRELIGSCGFYKWEHEPHRRAEVGYDLDPAYWRRGIMKEALTAIIDYGFDKMELNRISLLAFAFNEASTALARSLGFVREGVFRENSFHKGKFEDDEFYALLRSDWEQTRSSRR